MSLLLLAVLPATADDRVPIEQLSLEDMLNTEVTVGTRAKALGARETPGIVSVITRQEIQESGARDLIDVLRTIPGVDFGVDVQGIVGLGIRGLWAYEGKVLMRIDGVEVNETAYSTIPFGGRFPADLIERVEVIRGPGSVSHGGFAELAAIEVTTLAGAGADHARVAIAGALMAPGPVAGGQADLSFATTTASGLRIGVDAFGGARRRSQGPYTDVYGGTYETAGASALRPFRFGAHLGKGDFVASIGAERYRTTYGDGYDAITDRTLQTDFDSAWAVVRNPITLSERVRMTPEASVRAQLPWYTVKGLDAADGIPWFNVYAIRGVLSNDVTVKASDVLDVNSGVEGTVDRQAPGPGAPADSTPSVVYFAGAIHTEAVATPKIATFVGGVRLDLHSEYRPSVVPRFAITRAGDVGHVKAQVASAFRAPGNQQILIGLDVRPEVLWPEIEGEAGVRLGEPLYATANVFWARVRDPIVYIYEVADDGSVTEGYRNEGITGSRGGEFDLRWQTTGVSAGLNYALYLADPAAGDVFAVPDQPALLGFANHSGSARLSVRPVDRLSISASVWALGPKYAITALDADENAVYSALPAAAVVALFVRTTDLLPGLELGAGVHDLLDARPPFVQPYNGLHTPLPGPGRELYAKVAYNF